jgi:hypothetical protein
VGTSREFLWRVTKDAFEDKWTFRVETEDNWRSNQCFELSVAALDDDTVRVIMMKHHEQEEYRAKGIPDALLPEIKRHLAKNVESSPEAAESGGVYRTQDATKVWKRLETKGLATYNEVRDVYLLL